MPPRSKRKIQLEQARSQKISKRSESSQTAIEPAATEPLSVSPLPSTSGASFSEPVDSAQVEIDYLNSVPWLAMLQNGSSH